MYASNTNNGSALNSTSSVRENGYYGENKVVHRGEIYYSYMSEVNTGSEMRRDGRPCLVVSREDLCESSGCVCAVYLTSSPKYNMDTHVIISNNRRNSTVLCEQVYSISKSRLGDCAGKISDDEMRKVDEALACSLGIPFGLDEEELDSEVVRIKIERDTYKKMYDSLINRITKK